MTTENKPRVEVGDVVRYVDHHGVEHLALVTATWNGQGDGAINLVYVEIDEAKHDTWGRQIGRDSSVPHRVNQAAPGNYWTRIGE